MGATEVSLGPKRVNVVVGTVGLIPSDQPPAPAIPVEGQPILMAVGVVGGLLLGIFLLIVGVFLVLNARAHFSVLLPVGVLVLFLGLASLTGSFAAYKVHFAWPSGRWPTVPALMVAMLFIAGIWLIIISLWDAVEHSSGAPASGLALAVLGGVFVMASVVLYVKEFKA